MKQTADFRKDTGNILLLLFLYILQGIPLGLMASIPLILLNRQVSYTDQAKFSFAYWPFSLKLIWAPIVDAVYSKKIGRRKSWLIPMQYLLGLFMLVLSLRVEEMLDTLNVTLITSVFFMLNFLAATQDIAVDGWALTMLKSYNLGYASTCNSVGQTAGYFLGYVVFLALESADFCNKFFRSQPETYGFVTLPGFLYFWGWIFIVTTTLVWVFKSEKQEANISDESNDVVSSYLSLWKILKLPLIKKLLLLLLTAKIGFAAADSVTGLKLVEIGVPKDRLAFLAIPLTPLQIILPLFISKYTAGANPMNVYLKAMPIRLLFGIVFAGIVWITPAFKQPDGSFPFYYYAGIVVVYSIHQISLYSMFVAVMAFFAKISDPVVGGTYMTLLNTICNLGGNWPSTVALWLIDPLTSKSCSNNSLNDCSSQSLKDSCTAKEGTCKIDIDGYYIESFVFLIIGFIWLYSWGKPTILKLQKAHESSWKISSVFHQRLD